MNETNGVWWNIVDTVSRLAVVVLGACLGWLGKRFRDIDGRMDALEKDFNARNLIAATSIATLEAYHTANTQRLNSIEDTTQKIDGKLDRLIESLVERKRR